MSGQPDNEDDDVRRLSDQLREARQWFEAKLAEADADRGRLAEAFLQRGVELERMSAELAQVKRHLASQQELDRIYAEGMLPAASGQTGPLPRVPGSRHASHAAHRTPKDKRWLKVVPTLIPAGALAAFKPLSHALKASWAAHPVATAAAGTVAFSVATAAVVAAPHAAATFIGGGTAGAPAPAASVWSATPMPVPSQLPVAAYLTKPGANTVSSLPFVTDPSPRSYVYVPAAGNPAPPQAPGSQQAAPAPAGPAVLQVDTTPLDLSGGTAQTITISATGTGWVSWHISTDGSDLDFSPSRGVLRAGQSVTVTVTLGATQDGLLSQVFEVGGQQVTVSLPPLPAPLPTPTDVLPSGLPSLPGT